MEHQPEPKLKSYVMTMPVGKVVPTALPIKRPQVPMRRSVDTYSWWQHKDREFPVCVVDKVCVGQGADFRVTHIKTLKIGESNPTTIKIETFWELVDTGTIKNVTQPTEVRYVETV